MIGCFTMQAARCTPLLGSFLVQFCHHFVAVLPVTARRPCPPHKRRALFCLREQTKSRPLLFSVAPVPKARATTRWFRVVVYPARLRPGQLSGISYSSEPGIYCIPPDLGRAAYGTLWFPCTTFWAPSPPGLAGLARARPAPRNP